MSLRMMRKLLKRTLKRKKKIRAKNTSGAEARTNPKMMRNLMKRILKRKVKAKNTSGAEAKIKKMMFPLMVRPQADCFHSFVKRPFPKSMLKTSYGNLKWNSCRVMWQWKWPLQLWKV